MTNIHFFKLSQIQSLIYTIRGVQVMLDSDLANLYGVETRILNQAVKRNSDRFPGEFRFQLTTNEIDNLKSQFVTSSSTHGGRRKLPYVFTEQGVAMLSAVLRSATAIKVSIQIINAFVSMRKFVGSNARLFQRIDQVEIKQLADKTEIDKKFEIIFDAIEQKEISPKQGIIYDGQIFDAHAFIAKIIRSARKSIIIVDNYIDASVLALLTNKKMTVMVKIYTKTISKRLALDIKKFNEQYGQLVAEEITNNHDRFIIIDENTIYHTGASLKDLGKKISAFSKFDKEGLKLLGKLK
ncbi:MAG: ORF6N domain-containing protein [Candidatus Marinimicrobia bacterium]|nr:ORF6N domain-containing protein [Candidatus Neomarinimicrobiota bacterium]